MVAVGLWLLTSIGVGGIYPLIVQRFQVQPDELNKEVEFVAHNIEFTREAYGLTDIEVKEFGASTDLTAPTSRATATRSTTSGCGIRRSLFTTYQQLQAIVTFYDVQRRRRRPLPDRGRADAGDGLVAQPRRSQHPRPRLGERRLVYTHGFGAVLSPANSVTVEGQPDFLVKDIPPVRQSTNWLIDEPRVYFSDDASTEYVIAGTSQPEVDFPLGGSAATLQYNTYQGDGGVELGGFFRRLAFAARFANFDTLISSRLEPDSQVLLVRNIRDRIDKVLPGFSIPGRRSVPGGHRRQSWCGSSTSTRSRISTRTRPGAPTERLDATPGLAEHVQLHPQLGQGDRQRIRRRDDLLCRG